jgi:F0F1-type ATP synthase delta subunit
MKISAKQYAEALYLATEQADEAKARRCVAELASILKQRGRSRLLPDIMRAYEETAMARSGSIRAKAVLASEPDQAVREALALIVCSFSGAESAEVEVSVDPSILGGVVLSYGDKLLDGSLRASLRGLRRSMGS